jgi:acyl-CoA reductase-like NAD-dependent aldehyde dehydrogenase
MLERTQSNEPLQTNQAGGPLMTMHAVLDPCTAETIAHFELATTDEVDAAVDAAKQAFPIWAAVSTQDRARALRRFADTVGAHAEELALLEARNVGKPIDGARWEAEAVADVLHYYAGAVDKHTGTTLPWGPGLALTLREPLGVVGLITPWNFPMMIAAWKLGPALAAGNTVVLKPSELTPLTTIRLGELALESGIPDGVVNVIVGDGAVAGQHLVDHRDVAKIGFTGSTATGKRIMRSAADTLTRVTLELGGKSANVVFADADLEAAANGVPGSVFDNAGQDCCARSRILVERSIHDRFVDMVVEASRPIKVGTPFEDGVFMGPLISSAHHSKVTSFEGEGDIAFRGKAPNGPGFWYPPTVITGVDEHSRIANEEVFGPVVVVIPFDDEADAARLANNTIYGLSGSIWTRDASRAMRMARAVQSGTMSVNSNSSVRYATPFGGYKQSGIGRDLSMDALGHYSETKTVYFA